MPTYSTSKGTRISTQTIDRLVRSAKETKLRNMQDEYGFVMCENNQCNKAGNVRLDCSHVISVKEAKETGRAELCYDINNIKILCRECHQKKDGLNLKFSNE